MRNAYGYIKSNELSGYCIAHHGILGMKWGVRRYQNEDGSLTDKGKKRYLQNQDWEYSHLNKRGQKSLLIDQEAYGKYVVGKMEEDSQKEREEEYNQRIKDGEKLLKDADILTNPDFSDERTKDAIDFLISGYAAYNEPELKSLFKHRKEYSDEEFAKRLLSKDSGKAMVAMADLWIQGYSIPDIKAMVTYSSSSGNGILSKMPKSFLNGLSKREKDNSTSLSSFIEEADIEYGGPDSEEPSIRDKEKGSYKNFKHSALSGYCIAHHGIKGQKWGVRRYQNADGSLTAAGVKRYGMTKDKNSRYIGTPKGFIKAYNKDSKNIYKQMKSDIKEDQTLSKEEKKIYKKNAKQIINNFLDDKYDVKISELKKDRKAEAGTIAAHIAIDAAISALLLPLAGRVVAPVMIPKADPNRLYRIENNSKKGVSTLYDRKGREISNSKNKVENKKESKRFIKTVGSSASLRMQYANNPTKKYDADYYKKELVNGAKAHNTYFKPIPPKPKKEKQKN